VHVYPHDTSAYTEGLFYKDGYLYESTGEAGESTVRKVELETGKVLQRHDVPDAYFGEGIVDWNHELIQLTWKSELGFVYDLASFRQQRTFRYPGEGWALTRDSKHLYMSDGSAVLRVLDPNTLTATGSIMVTDNGEPVTNLNELEWVKGEIYANVWMTNRIARIDPATGHVTGWIDLSGLLDVSRLPDPGNDVLNGIAYDEQHDRLFVTGKRWPKLFEITLVKP
jgi:glutaminyl-peptide cyclotransferase